MNLLSIHLLKGVNTVSWIISSILAGYVMYLVDIALEGWFGLFGTYKTYKQWLIDAEIFKGLEDIALFLGHELNSLLLALFFVNPFFYKKLPDNLFLKGVAFAILWHIAVMIVVVIAGLGGSKWMYSLLTMPLKDHISFFLLHIVWGLTLSYTYIPKERKN